MKHWKKVVVALAGAIALISVISGGNPNPERGRLAFTRCIDNGGEYWECREQAELR